MTTAWLSFEVRMVRSAQDLREACAVRVAGYGHHLPQLKKALAEPDEIDHDRGTAVLVCLDKTTGRGIGTARIQRAGPQAPVQLESSVELPEWLAQRPRAEITRLATVPGADALVRPMLMKASYLYCLASQARWMVIGARSEALVRMYRRLGFTDVLPGQESVPLAHAGGLQHRILMMDVVAAERTWYQGQHGMYELMIETYHPDIQILSERRAWPQAGRAAA